MGGGGSRPIPFQLPIPQPQAPPPPPDPQAAKQQRQVELTMAKNDVVDKQAAYDIVAPDEAGQRKINAALPIRDAYISEKQKQYDYEYKLFNSEMGKLDILSNNASFMLAQKYKKTLKQKYNDVSSEYIKHKEHAFTNKRRFDDSDPQSGTPGIYWFSSIDEQVLVLFWTAYIIFIGTMLSFLVEYIKIHYPMQFAIYGPSWLGTLLIIIYLTYLIMKAFV
jgi:hypothetical protein